MSRKRNPKRDEAFEIWKKNKGEITNRAIAEQIDVPEKTISAWKSRDKWNAVLQEKKRSTTKKNRSTANDSTRDSRKSKKDSTSNAEQKKQSNRSGNPNPKNQFTKRNQAARTHGLFANFIQPEQQEIIDSMQDLTIADQIWMQIEIKFSAIIRMQKIMWVEHEEDHLKELSGHHSSEGGGGANYAVVYAHERYEAYIKAQARAMAEYRNLVKSYIDLTDEFDERRLKLEGMQMNIDKTKAELESITSGNTNNGGEDWTEALMKVAERRRAKNEKE